MKRILVISPIPTHPQIAGNRTRIHRLLESLKALGHDVHFVYVNTESDSADEAAMRECWKDGFSFVPYRWPRRSLRRYATRLQFLFERGFRDLQPVDYRYDPSLDAFLHQLSAQKSFDVVIVEYIFWSRAFLCFDDRVLKILDTHDVFTRRHLLYREVGETYGWYCTSAREEAKALNRADVVIAIQEQERAYFTSLTRKEVITVGHIAPTVAPRARRRVTPHPGRRLLFLGSENGANLFGVNFFLREVLPRITAVLPDMQFVLAGKICERVGDAEGCIKLGTVADLAELYAGADIVLNPLQFSTGLSIKTVEALGHGMPVVTTPAGARGIEEGAGRAFLVAASAEEFANAVLRIARDSALAQSLSDEALRFVENWNERSLHALARILECEP